MQQKLSEMVAKAIVDRTPAAIVGFTAAYALAVHEDVEMKLKGFSRDPRVRRIEMGGDPAKARPRPRKREPKGRFWDPQGKGQAKFLEQPAREMQQLLAQEIMAGMAAKMTLAKSLMRAALLLQRAAQLLVPVDTSNLKNSAFTRLEIETAPTVEMV